jgi:hypothetical protein
MIAIPRSSCPKRACLAVCCLFFVSTAAHSLSISLLTGAWNPDISALLPTVAGSNLSASTFISATNQSRVRVVGNTDNFTWRVTVQRTAGWYSGLDLLVQRTNTNASITGGLTYITVTATAMEFYRSIAVRISFTARCQYQLTGLTAAMGTSNTTTVTYTVLQN